MVMLYGLLMNPLYFSCIGTDALYFDPSSGKKKEYRESVKHGYYIYIYM